MEKLLTDKEVAAVLDVSRRVVQEMALDGRLRGGKVGKRWRFTRDDVDFYIAQLADRKAK